MHFGSKPLISWSGIGEELAQLPGSSGYADLYHYSRGLRHQPTLFGSLLLDGDRFPRTRTGSLRYVQS